MSFPKIQEYADEEDSDQLTKDESDKPAIIDQKISNQPRIYYKDEFKEEDSSYQSSDIASDGKKKIISLNKTKKKKEKSNHLKMFRVDSNTSLPKKEQVEDTMKTFKKGFSQLGQIIIQMTLYSLTKAYDLICQIVALIGRVLQLIVKWCIFPISEQINKHCLKKVNQKDPWGRRLSKNINWNRLKELNNVYECGEKALNLILDLDETIVHVINKKQKQDYKECVVKFQSGQSQTLYVKQRPFLDKFLEESSKYYNIIIYTDKAQEYSDAVIEMIDKNKVIYKRFYKQHCMIMGGAFIKEITIVNKDLSRSVLIDNCSTGISLNKDNSFLIKSFKGDDDDDLLIEYLVVLQHFADKKGDFRDMIQEVKKVYDI